MSEERIFQKPMTKKRLREIGESMDFSSVTPFLIWKMSTACNWYGGEIQNLEDYKGPPDPPKPGPQYPRIHDHADNIF